MPPLLTLLDEMYIPRMGDSLDCTGMMESVLAQVNHWTRVEAQGMRTVPNRGILIRKMIEIREDARRLRKC